MTDMTSILERIGRPRILVIGDVILDRYTWGNAERVSPEAPVLVLRADTEEVRLGGAASVAGLLSGLEAEVRIAGVLSEDASGRTLRKLFQESSLDDRLVFVDPDRPTTTKERFIGRAGHRHPYQILRVDHETRDPIPGQLEQRLVEGVVDSLGEVDAVLISNYAKGVCTPCLLETVISAATGRGLPVVVDPARIPDYERYRGATVLTPNRAEAESVTGQPIETPQQALVAGNLLCERYALGATIVTLDRDGMALTQAGETGTVFATKPRAVYDITGAGDMVLAVVGLCQAAGIPLTTAVRLANVAAGLEVERLGVAPVSRNEIRAELQAGNQTAPQKLVTLEQMVELASAYRGQGQRIVFTNGCFDLLHVGHLRCLQEAAALGDVLVVAINCDAVVKQLKGPGRPVVNQHDRASLLGALNCVDHVMVFDEETPHRLLNEIRPAVLAKGGTTEEVIGREVVEAYGGTVTVVRQIEGVSTTNILLAMNTTGRD